jgi:hypothetical protein
MYRTLSIAAPCLLWLLLSCGSLAAQDPGQAKNELDQALAEQAEIQKEVRQWNAEKRALVNEILSLKTRLAWHRYQNEKYEAYIKRQKRTIAGLQQKIEEMKVLRMELEPYLEGIISEMEDFVRQDMAFLDEERQERLAFLRESMNTYHLSLNEKLRRVLEALQVEAQYGQSTGVVTRTVRVDGQKLQVEVLRLGRVARFYRSLDGTKVGRWNEEKGAWQPLDPGYSRDIGRAIDMASQKQAVELVDLPIGGSGS